MIVQQQPTIIQQAAPTTLIGGTSMAAPVTMTIAAPESNAGNPTIIAGETRTLYKAALEAGSTEAMAVVVKQAKQAGMTPEQFRMAIASPAGGGVVSAAPAPMVAATGGKMAISIAPVSSAPPPVMMGVPPPMVGQQVLAPQNMPLPMGAPGMVQVLS